MKVVYLLTKMIQIKRYTICSFNQLGLEVERPEWRTTFSFFAILHNKRNIFSFYAIFPGSFMKFPIRASGACKSSFIFDPLSGTMGRCIKNIKSMGICVGV